MELHPMVGLWYGLEARSGPSSFVGLVRCSESVTHYSWKSLDSSVASGLNGANSCPNAGLAATQLATFPPSILHASYPDPSAGFWLHLPSQRPLRGQIHGSALIFAEEEDWIHSEVKC